MFKDRVIFIKSEQRVITWRAGIAVVALLAMSCPLQAQEASAGRVHFVVRTDPSFDTYLKSPSNESKQWFQSHVWRMMVYSPFFDNKLTWYPAGWVYVNLYGLHTDSQVVRDHPEWLLRDAQSNPLYIPYDCANGSCPLYAADVSNSQYRSYWISRARELVSKGYRGLWIDDVNLEFRVSDGSGHHVAPVEPSAGRTMPYEDWKSHVAEFCEEIRRAFPDSEILHNAIWYAGGPKRDSDPSVARELQAADYINLERGVADSGLTGGEREWSLDAFFRYVDRRHSAGKGVVVDNTGNLGQYGLAAYFLISSGKDALGGHDVTPDHWLAALDFDLGAPLGPRTKVGGVFRREFERGVVLLNEPRAQPEAILTCADCVGVDGQFASSVRLMPGQGAILLRGNMRSVP
jgi:hypothetical protein